MTVLITGAGAGGAVQIIQSLRKGLPGVRIIGVDAADLATGRYFSDSYYVVPMAYETSYVNVLLDICKQEKVQVALISVDEEIAVLVKNKARFAGVGTELALAEPESVLLCLDKSKLHAALSGKGIPLPKTWLLEQFDYSDDCQYVVKPRSGRGSRGIYCIERKSELKYLKSKLPPKDYLVQQRICGQEYTVDVLKNRQGEFLATIPRIRLETDSGLSVKGRTVFHKELIEKSQLVMNILGLWGAANIQWIIDNAGAPWLIEVNPRLAGTVILSVAAGVNIPAELVKLFSSKDYRGQAASFRDGVLMLRYWQAIFVEEKS